MPNRLLKYPPPKAPYQALHRQSRHCFQQTQMRGTDTFTESLFLMKRLDDFVPADHPLRTIREMVNKALAAMDTLFAGM